LREALMDIEIGSNLYRNTDGTIEVEGVPQILLTQKKPSGPLLVNFVIYDEVGRVVAKIVDSTMAFNERRAHELNRTASGLTITLGDSGKVILKLEVGSEGRVIISHAEFLTIKGHLLEVSPTEWRIETKRVAKQMIDANGTAAAIG
jgi:hypothetical protein